MDLIWTISTFGIDSNPKRQRGMLIVASLALRVTVLLAIALPSWSMAKEPSSDIAEVRFSRHIVPMFSRLGCNGGTCHGKVKGLNGFRLSLFGAQPEQDYASLRQEFGGRRVNISNPDSSLLLLKATGQISHGGGKRIEVGSDAHRMIRDWIVRGGTLDKVEDSAIAELRVTPNARSLQTGERYSLKVDAVFADGSVEDVARLCTFKARDASVVEVDRDGNVRVIGVGDTSIVVRFRSEPVVSLAFVPAESSDPFPSLKATNFIDEQIFAKLRRLNVAPAELCDDVAFLRRASLDIAAELPSPDEIRAFVTDTDPNKRAKKMDELLRRPGHAALWATKFCDVLKPQFREDNRVFDEAAYVRRFYEWIRARLVENTPYDQFVERIITATSADGRSPEAVVAELETLATEDANLASDLSSYTRRKTLDMYWLRARANGVFGTVQFSHAFLGLRLRCAQCHRHPSDVWQQDDLMSFANFFNRVAKVDQYKIDKGEKKALDDEVKKLQAEIAELKKKAADKKLPPDEAERLRAEAKALETKVAERRKFAYLKHHFTHVRNSSDTRTVVFDGPLGRVQSRQFRLLGEREPIEVKPEQDPRQIVMKWLRAPDNPFFARAIVNRVWAHYFGRGIVDPPDDLSPLNPPSHPELLVALAQRFIESGFDLRWLHSTIANSRTYQQANQPRVKGTGDLRNYTHHPVQRLRAELVVDAINHAIGAANEFPENAFLPPGTKAIEVPGAAIYPAGGGSNKPAAIQYAFETFGRPKRDVEIQCDCDNRTDLSLVQSLYLTSYEDILKKVVAEDGRPLKIAKETNENARRVEEAFLWTLARFPTDAERTTFAKHLAEAKSGEEGMKDVFWVLLNTHEFLLQK